jgi:hypothetical protein
MKALRLSALLEKDDTSVFHVKFGSHVPASTVKTTNKTTTLYMRDAVRLLEIHVSSFYLSLFTRSLAPISLFPLSFALFLPVFSCISLIFFHV